MLDPKFLTDEISTLKIALRRRGVDEGLADKTALFAGKRSQIKKQLDVLRTERNKVSAEIGILKRNAGKDPALLAQLEAKLAETRIGGEKLASLEGELRLAEEQFQNLALTIPNIPHSSVPDGKSESDNLEIRRWGEPNTPDFQILDHLTIGEKLGLLDIERAGKMSGARFSLYIGAGATLERALIQFMLDTHTRVHGYREVIPPFMVNRAALVGTGNLPKFEDDLFRTTVGERELFMIPTAEVPLTNIYREEIIEPGTLPAYFTAYSPCFRSEAGSYGRDVKGLIRQHQFQKVEMVKIVEPETSYEEHDKMAVDAERILQLLELPYRVISLCTGDLGFGSTKTYDLEVWLPSQNTYREISSCSNCEDFQARRAGIRFRDSPREKPRFAHTLNGSGLAVGRTFIAILENKQTSEGLIRVPKVLERYLDGAPGFLRAADGSLVITGIKSARARAHI